MLRNVLLSPLSPWAHVVPQKIAPTTFGIPGCLGHVFFHLKLSCPPREGAPQPHPYHTNMHTMSTSYPFPCHIHSLGKYGEALAHRKCGSTMDKSGLIRLDPITISTSYPYQYPHPAPSQSTIPQWPYTAPDHESINLLLNLLLISAAWYCTGPLSFNVNIV